MSADDMELLRRYAQRHCEQSFSTLVSRHVKMVYSVALRQVGSPDHAEEITQAVFITLDRKSRSLRTSTVLSGWLFQAARLTSINFIRKEIRRKRREQEAFMQSCLDNQGESVWMQIKPLLNDAVAMLKPEDRDAIVLRYMDGLDIKGVATTLGVTEDAAKKRLGRALDKLRRCLSLAGGIPLEIDLLAKTISAKSVEPIPSGLTAVVATGAIYGTAKATSITALASATMRALAWQRRKSGLAAAAIILLAGGILVVFLRFANGTDPQFVSHSEAAVQPIHVPGEIGAPALGMRISGTINRVSFSPTNPAIVSTQLLTFTMLTDGQKMLIKTIYSPNPYDDYVEYRWDGTNSTFNEKYNDTLQVTQANPTLNLDGSATFETVKPGTAINKGWVEIHSHNSPNVKGGVSICWLAYAAPAFQVRRCRRVRCSFSCFLKTRGQ